MDDTDTSLTTVLADVNADLRRCDWLAALGDETQRKIIALMLFAADHPDWAWINFYTYLGRMTPPRIAELRGVSQSNVRRLLKLTVPTEIYDRLPPVE